MKYTGRNTTPKIYRDRANQFGPTVMDVSVSLYCEFKDESPWSVSPEVTIPRTPDYIPRYFTSEYQQRREAQNLPREVTFQGPLEFTPEDPLLPPQLRMDYPEWGVICQEPDKFNLLEYMEEMCNNITPPRDSSLF